MRELLRMSAPAAVAVAVLTGCPAPTTVESPLPPPAESSETSGAAPIDPESSGSAAADPGDPESSGAAELTPAAIGSGEPADEGSAAGDSPDIPGTRPEAGVTDSAGTDPVGCGPDGQTCPSGKYCHVPDGRCGELALGECEQVATICTREFRPVCGCDGRTYANACGAAAEGVSVRSQGECQPGR